MLAGRYFQQQHIQCRQRQLDLWLIVLSLSALRADLSDPNGLACGDQRREVDGQLVGLRLGVDKDHADAGPSSSCQTSWETAGTMMSGSPSPLAVPESDRFGIPSASGRSMRPSDSDTKPAGYAGQANTRKPR